MYVHFLGTRESIKASLNYKIDWHVYDKDASFPDALYYFDVL